MRALRLPTHASPVTYLFRFQGPRDSSSVRARRCQRSRAVEVPPQAKIIVQPVISNCRRTFTWTRVGPLRFPDDPSCASAPFQDPGRTDAPSPIMVASSAAPAVEKAKAPACSQYRGYSAALAPAVYASRAVLPPPHARLASGWLASLCREGVEPSGS